MLGTDASSLQDYFAGITSIAKDVGAGAKELTEVYGSVRKIGIDAGVRRDEINADVEKARIAANQRATAANARTTGNAPVVNFLTGTSGGIPHWALAVGALAVLFLVVRK